MNNKPIYMAAMTPGLEDIVIDEISKLLEDVKIEGKMRGKVFFSYGGDKDDLYLLRTVNNIYIFLDEFNLGPHKKDLEEIKSSLNLERIKKSLNTFWKPKGKKIIVSASRSGKHTYSRYDLGDRILEALSQDNSFIEGTIENHDLAFRADLIEDRLYLFIKMTPSSFRFRGKERGFLKGALAPPIAHALVWLSEPEFDDIFLDPFCGSGTIASERSYYDAYSIMASDISLERLEIARDNLPDYVGINSWDAGDMDLSDESINKIVTNPPWGKQIEVDNIELLYNNFLKEAYRVLSFQGKIIILTDEEDIIKKAAKENGFELEKLATLSLHGLLPSIFKLKK